MGSIFQRPKEEHLGAHVLFSMHCYFQSLVFGCRIIIKLFGIETIRSFYPYDQTLTWRRRTRQGTWSVSIANLALDSSKFVSTEVMSWRIVERISSTSEFTHGAGKPPPQKRSQEIWGWKQMVRDCFLHYGCCVCVLMLFAWGNLTASKHLTTTGIHIQAQRWHHVANSFDSSIQVIIRLENQILAHLGIWDMNPAGLTWRELERFQVPSRIPVSLPYFGLSVKRWWSSHRILQPRPLSMPHCPPFHPTWLWTPRSKFHGISNGWNVHGKTPRGTATTLITYSHLPFTPFFQS